MKEKNRLKKTGDETLAGSSGKRQHSLRNALKTFWKWKFLVLACFLIVFLVLCGVHYFRNASTASTVNSFFIRHSPSLMHLCIDSMLGVMSTNQEREEARLEILTLVRTSVQEVDTVMSEHES